MEKKDQKQISTCLAELDVWHKKLDRLTEKMQKKYDRATPEWQETAEGEKLCDEISKLDDALSYMEDCTGLLEDLVDENE